MRLKLTVSGLFHHLTEADQVHNNYFWKSEGIIHVISNVISNGTIEVDDPTYTLEIFVLGFIRSNGVSVVIRFYEGCSVGSRAIHLVSVQRLHCNCCLSMCCRT